MSDTAVLVVDMMNSYQHPDAEALIPNVGKTVDPLPDLIRRARESDDVDLIYVNDNYGDFTAQFADIVESACNGERPDLVDPIVPAEGSRLLTKVRHSAYYATPLAYLLCVAHIDDELGEAALKMMERNMSAELTTAAHCLG
ncbi:isochorismatase family protein [Mycobacterium shigaense]|nr:isochorismatase family protein [Mycobacterium shigaense]MEA1123413.1 isochorismatase family protein [Mycobacterium shigaense]PRI15791.1 isochorismatase [Mycobacterium shigaense]